MALQCNSSRYCTCETLNPFESYSKITDKAEEIEKSKEEFNQEKASAMQSTLHIETIKFPKDEFLDEETYKKYIDEWIKKVENSPAKAVKVVLYFHGNAMQILSFRKSKILQGEDGYFHEKANEETMKCVNYLLNKISECKKSKNINIINTACYKAHYFYKDGEEKGDLIKDMLIPFAEKISEKNKNVIYTSNFSENSTHRSEENNIRDINEYSIYNSSKKSFIKISPEIDKQDKLNYEAKYVPAHDERIDKLDIELLYLKDAITQARDKMELNKPGVDNCLEKITDALNSDDRFQKEEVIGQISRDYDFDVDWNEEQKKEFNNFKKKTRYYDIYGSKKFANDIREAKKNKNEILFQLNKTKEKNEIDINAILNDKYSSTNGWNGENDKDVVSTLEKIELEDKKIETNSRINLKDKNQNQINEIK